MSRPSPSATAWEFDGVTEPVASNPPVATATATAAENDLVLQHLNARGFVPFHPALAHNLGHKAALFLGLCLYWTRHSARNNPQRHGWIHLSANEISDATTLTRREQDTVRAMLAGTGVLEQQLAGRPAKMHFRLNLRLLANRLEIIDAATATVETAWAWFEKSVSFYRPLGDLAGNAAGGLYLSFALRQQRKALLAGGLAELVQLLPEEIERTLSLSPKVQRTVRNRLKQLGLLTLSPESAHLVRINIQAILACVRGQSIATLPKKGPAAKVRAAPVAAPRARRNPAIPHTRTTATQSADLIPQPDLLMSAGTEASGGEAQAVDRISMLRLVMLQPGRQQQVADFQQLAPFGAQTSADGPKGISRLEAGAQSAKLEVKPGAQSAKLEMVSSAQSAKLEQAGSAQTAKLEVPKPPNYIQTGITNTTTTNKRAKHADREDSADCRRRQVDVSEPGPVVRSGLDDLIFPSTLPAAVLPGMRDALLQAPADLRQQLLDELQGQLLIPTKTIHNPTGYLLGLIRGCRNGAVLALAEQVASDRERRSAVQRQVQRDTPAVEQSPIASPQVREEARARLQALRQEYVSKGARS